MTHHQLVDEWKEKLNKRFLWKHSPEGRGYLCDIEGCQTVDEVIMFDFAERFALAAAKGAAEAGRVQEFVPPIKLEPDFTTTAYNLARSQSERQLDEYFKGHD